MTSYTPDDFATARFATHPDGHVAMRCLVRRDDPTRGVWHREYGGSCRDRDMPGLGYEPVVDACRALRAFAAEWDGRDIMHATDAVEEYIAEHNLEES